MEQPLHILPQPSQLVGGGQGAGEVPLPVHPHRQEPWALQGLVLHGLEHLRVGEQQPRPAQLLFPHGLELVRRDIPLGGEDLVPGGEIQHPGGLDVHAEPLPALLFQGEQVQQHLNVQAHPDGGQVKGLFAGLVVHHPEIQLVVLHPAVHPVHLAADPQLRVRLADRHRRQLPAVAEGQLEGQGHEVGAAHLLGDLVHHRVGGAAQPGEEIPEPSVPALQIPQLFHRVLVDVPPHQGVEILLPHGGKAASVQHVLRDVLQQVVEERADLGGVKGRRAAGLGLQTVLHEVGEVAAPQPLHPGGGHGDPLPVQRLYSAAGQAAPLQCRRPLHGRQRGGVVGGSRKIPPQGPIRGRSGRLQRRDRCC